MDELRVISAGAARNLVGRLTGRLDARPGGGLAGRLDARPSGGLTARLDAEAPRLRATFGPVGVVEATARREPTFDVVITSRIGLPALAALCASGTAVEIGLVPTALALHTTAPTTSVPIDDVQELRALLLAAPGLYCADLATSTAGRYVARLLADFGLEDALRDRLRIHADGAAALRALAGVPAAAERAAAPPLAIAQLTEIVAAQGLSHRRLPAAVELTTSYVAAVGARSARPDAAHDLVALLTGEGTAGIRAECGFTPPS